jgi:hypothetical protein
MVRPIWSNRSALDIFQELMATAREEEMMVMTSITVRKGSQQSIGIISPYCSQSFSVIARVYRWQRRLARTAGGEMPRLVGTVLGRAATNSPRCTRQ